MMKRLIPLLAVLFLPVFAGCVGSAETPASAMPNADADIELTDEEERLLSYELERVDTLAIEVTRENYEAALEALEKELADEEQ